MRQVPLSSVAVRHGFYDGDWVESKDQDPSGEIRLLQLADVGDGVFRDRSDRRITFQTFSALRCSWVLPGDILIARMPDPLGRACLVPDGLGPTITVVDVAVLRCDRSIADPRYIVYSVNSLAVRSAMESLQDGATRQRIPRKVLGRVHIALPDLDEQRAIADCLDAETARIDTLIAKQQQLLDGLQERRVGVLAAMLDPAIGAGTPFKYFYDEIDERAGEAGFVVDELPLLSVSIHRGVHRRESERGVLTRAEDLSNYKVARRDDVVVNRMRAFQGALGAVSETGLVSPDYLVIRLRPSVDPTWISRAMKTPAFVGEMASRIRGIGSVDLGAARTPRINPDDLGMIKICAPSVADQRACVEALDNQTAEIDVLITKIERFIEVARERRAALITAAVTGQIDGRTLGAA